MQLASLVPAPVRSIFEKWRADAAAKEQAKADRGKSIVEKLAAGEASTKDLDQAVADGWEPGQLEAAAAQLATERALEKQIASRDEVLARRAKAIADQAEGEVKFQAMLSTFRAEAKELKAIEAACDAELAAISTATQQLTKLRRDKCGPRVAEIERDIYRLAKEQSRFGEATAKGRQARLLVEQLAEARKMEEAALAAAVANDRLLMEFRTRPSLDSGAKGAVGTPEERAKAIEAAPRLRRRAAVAKDRREELEQHVERLQGFITAADRHDRLQEQIAKLQAELRQLLEAPPSGPILPAPNPQRQPAAA